MCQLDHVNIVTHDLHQTARFYANLLDLEDRDPPAPLDPGEIRWLYNKSGHAPFHINSVRPKLETSQRAFDRPFGDVTETGAIHHIALKCDNYSAMIERINHHSYEHEVRELPSAGLRQIFVKDPNRVVLELNFSSE